MISESTINTIILIEKLSRELSDQYYLHGTTDEQAIRVIRAIHAVADEYLNLHDE